MGNRFKFVGILLIMLSLCVFYSCSKPATNKKERIKDPEYIYNIADFVSNKKVHTDSAGNINGHEWVDLGLSVKWATCNVGANSNSILGDHEEFGDYFAWGEIAPKDTFTKENYICSNGKLYNAGIDTLFSISGHPELDAATANWGGSWRMPTRQEWEELVFLCDWEYGSKGGERGFIVKSKKNDASIFLPEAGHGNNKWRGMGFYWTSTMCGSVYDDSSYAFIFSDSGHEIAGIDVDENDLVPNGYEVYEGFSVRPVTE